MQPSDIGSYVAAGAPRLSPDGTTVAFVVTRVDAVANCYRSQIWLVAADGSRPAEPFTSGDHRDSGPTWSPDGRRLAFVSARGDDDTKTTLHIAPVAAGGETVTLATFDEGVDGLTWSPDGRHLAFTSRVRDARYDIDDVKRQPPRRITHFYFRLDNVGWTVDRPRHVHVIPTDGSAGPLDVTPGEFQFSSPAWSPDSRSLAFSGATHETWDIDTAQDLFRWTLGDSAPIALTGQTGSYGLPSWSPDGSRIAFLGNDEPMKSPQNGHVGVLDVTTGKHRWISTALDRTFQSYGESRTPIWDGEWLLTSAEDRGNLHVYRVAADESGEPELVIGGERCLPSFDQAGGVIAFAATTPGRPSEVYVWQGGEERRVTFVTDGFVAAATPQAPERFTAPLSNGVEVDVWVYLPPDHDPSKRYPALLNVHGGPFTQYGNRFFDEAQLQVTAGYIVVMSNPRGSSGREEAWGRAITGPKDPFGAGTGWGSVDFDDVMAALDEAIRRYPSIDPDRLGLLGGSYGGYMTSWAVSHTHRFKAACSERAVNNMASEDWTSDIATAFRFELGTTFFEGPQEYARISPISYARDIETPLLILHSEDDLRCPVEQAEQLFIALRLLGKEVEFYRFPAEGHELSRSGSPVHRIQRAELILEYFSRHL